MPGEVLWTGPPGAPVLVLAHGAGSGADTPFLEALTGMLADRGVRTARVEFAYMARRRTGARTAPPRADTLLGEYRAAIERIRDAAGGPVAIGGKSMGGRVASMVADDEAAAGRASRLVCLGYPFHPPGRPERLRTAHLADLRTPTLIVQGTRDPFGTRDEVAGYRLSEAIDIHWLEDGDHGFRPRVKLTGLTLDDHLAAAADAIAEFLR